MYFTPVCDLGKNGKCFFETTLKKLCITIKYGISFIQSRMKVSIFQYFWLMVNRNQFFFLPFIINYKFQLNTTFKLFEKHAKSSRTDFNIFNRHFDTKTAELADIVGSYNFSEIYLMMSVIDCAYGRFRIKNHFFLVHKSELRIKVWGFYSLLTLTQI